MIAMGKQRGPEVKCLSDYQKDRGMFESLMDTRNISIQLNKK